jgi:hypothetical protein
MAHKDLSKVEGLSGVSVIITSSTGSGSTVKRTAELSILVADAGPLVGLELGETRAFLSPEQARHMADLLRSASFRTREDELPEPPSKAAVASALPQILEYGRPLAEPFDAPAAPGARPRTMPGAEHVEHIELPAKYIGENGDPAAADGKPL